MSNEITIKQAMDRLRKAFKDEPDYAHGWHCNIAMMCNDSVMANTILDSGLAHQVGNDAATRFMKNCFDVETSNDMLAIK